MAWWWSGLEFGPLRATFPLQTSLTHVAPAWRILVAENSFIELSPTLLYFLLHRELHLIWRGPLASDFDA